MYPKEVDERFVLTPTTAQVYASGAEEYDELLADDKHADVKKEKAAKDKEEPVVDGAESLYNALYRLTGVGVASMSVDGTEGFLESLKQGFSKLLQWLKQFAVWLKQMIFGRKARVDRQSDDLSQLIKSGTLKDSVTYLRSCVPLYPITKSRKLGDIPNNLEWLKEEQKNIKAFVSNAKKVLHQAERTLTEWVMRYQEVVDGDVTRLDDFTNVVSMYEDLWKPLGLQTVDRNERHKILTLRGYIFGSFDFTVFITPTTHRMDVLKDNRIQGDVKYSTTHSTVKSIYDENERLTADLNSLHKDCEKTLRFTIIIMERAINRVLLAERTEPMKEISRFINSYMSLLGRFMTFCSVDILKVQENINRQLLATFK